MRSRLIASTAIAAMIGTAGFGMKPPAASAKMAEQQSFCRNAEPLPILPPEAADPQQQGQGGDRPRTDMAVSPPPPPPPPPASSPSYSAPADRESSEIVTTATARSKSTARVSAEGASSSRAVPSPDIRRPLPPISSGPRPQAGLLTAGEHDDLLNPELYAAYAGRSNLGQKIRDLPQVDTMRVLTVEVKDRAGRPVPFAQVKITCQDGNSLNMATQADGRAIFFPKLDQLSPRLTLDVSKGGRALGRSRALLLSDQAGGQNIGVTADRSIPDVAARAKKLDLMLVVDTTGSMGDEIRYLQSELTAIVSELAQRHQGLDVKVGFVFYRDVGDQYVTRTFDFDQDIGRVNGVLARQSANGGGDYPEAMDQALIRAVGASWRPDAVKSLVLVADAPPHNDKFGRTWAAAEAARAKRIQITPVAASGVGDTAEYAMRAMAALTQSRYLFLTDDSGIGNPHAAPAVDCYLVTRLDALLRRVIDSQISGRRIEPAKTEIIREVGNYDKGKCVLPADFHWQ